LTVAKGKHATASTNRANQAARDHIDRLTDQLAEQKMRARVAEEKARENDLLRERIAHLEHSIENDEMLKKFLKTWDPLANKFATFHDIFDDLKEAFYLAVRDVMMTGAETTFTGVTTLGYADVNEFVRRRYPKFGKHLDRFQREVSISHEDTTLLRLSDDQVRRLQRARGDRGAFPFRPESTVAEVLVDIVEALDADIRGEDLEEFIGIWESDWTAIAARQELRRAGLSKKQVAEMTDEAIRELPTELQRRSEQEVVS
jgi:hypothetical protein